MYESRLEQDVDLAPLGRGEDPALFNVGSLENLLRVHRRHAALAASGVQPELPAIGPYLMRRLADARTMRLACVDLLRGGKAPGVNGLCLHQLDWYEQWSLSRALARSIRDQTYRPGPDRKVKIPKEGKPGEYRQ